MGDALIVAVPAALTGGSWGGAAPAAPKAASSATPAAPATGGGTWGGLVQPTGASAKVGTTPTQQLAYSLAKFKANGDMVNYKKYSALAGAIPAGELAKAGIAPPAKGEGLLKQGMGAVGGAISTGLNLLDRPGQAVLGGLRDVVGGGGAKNILHDVGGALEGQGGGTSAHLGRINARQAIGVDKNAGGLLGGLADFVGSAALDPTTWLTLGTGALAEGGLKAITEAGLPELAAKISSGGLKSLAPEELAAAKEALTAGGEGLAKNSEKAASKQLAALARRGEGGIRLGTSLAGGHSLGVGGEALAGLPGAQLLSKGKSAVDATRGVQALKDAFIPRNAIVRNLGKDTANETKSVLNGSRIAQDAAVQKVYDGLVAANKATPLAEEFHAPIMEALQSGDPTALEQLKATLPAELHPMLDQMAQVREASGALRDPGAVEPMAAAGIGGRTPAWAQAQGAVEQPGVFEKELKTGAMAPQMVNSTGIRGAAETEIQNPLAAVLHEHIAAQRHAAEDSFLGTMAKSTAEKTGAAPVLKATATDMASPVRMAELAKKAEEQGMVKLAGHQAWAAPSIADHLKQGAAQVLNDDSLSKYKHLLNSTTQTWKSYKTLPMTGGLGFFSKFGQGHVFHNAMAEGAPKLRDYLDAVKMRGALKKLGPDATHAAMLEHGLTDVQASQLRSIIDKGTLGTGYTRTEVLKRAAQDTGGGLSPLAAPTTGLKDKLTSFGKSLATPNTPLGKPGRAASTFIDDTARIAHSVGQMNVNAGGEGAARSAAHYLMDYKDMTPFERNKIQPLIPFYSFMRNNTPLMAKQLADQPGRLTWIPKFQGNVMTDNSANAMHGKTAPDYALQDGGMPLPGPLARLLTGKKDVPVIGSSLLPPLAAFHDLQPLMDLAGLVPGAPKSMRGGTAQLNHDLLQIPGGPLPDLGKAMVGSATGRDLFTGGKEKTPFLQSLAEAAGAPVTKQSGILGALRHPTDPTNRAKLINDFGLSSLGLGQTITPVTQAKSDSVIKGKAFEAGLAGSADKKKAAAAKGGKGTPYSSLASLRKTGKIPKAAPRPKAPKTALGKLTGASKPKVVKASTVAPGF